MKLKAPSLSTGKRAALERTLKWLINVVTDLETRKAQLDELNSALQEAQQRKKQSEKNAAVNSDAALALAGVEAQLSRLSPQVQQLRADLLGRTEVACRQANTVRGNDLRELLAGPLIDHLHTSMTTVISPFFDADWARHYARQIMQSSNQWRQIMFYLNRPPVITTEFSAAMGELNALVSEIEKILAGGTLLEV
jgi:exonuclease VII small subunit